MLPASRLRTAPLESLSGSTNWGAEVAPRANRRSVHIRSGK
jgi:hypothetical protein